MIQLDTNILVDLATARSAQSATVRDWLREGKRLAVSAVAWSEFCNGPHTREQKNALRAVLSGGVLPFTEQQAEQASRLFHYTGRRRGSHADCMIAACAMLNGHSLASRNLPDFQRFVPHGLRFEPVPTAPENA
ncbi:MAG: PIN domain-containing protein [Verrucomicrobia bacterium]|nr:PIN domain-containing protein [Verrucomicrobiota bacterium]